MGRIKKANSEKLTGEEVGRLLLKNTIHTYKQSIVGKDPKPILSQKELDKMVGGIDFTEARNRDMYNRYVSLDNWTSKYLSILNTIYSDARSEIKTLLIYINGMLLVQDSLLAYYSIPLVEEKKEFEKNTKELVKDYIEVLEESNIQTSFSLTDLFLKVISFSKNKKINKLLEKYKTEKPTSPYVKKNYISATGNKDSEGLEDLTKYDIINDISLTEMYPNLFPFDHEYLALGEYEAEAFKEDFSELIDLVLEDIEKTLKLEKLDFDRDKNKEILSFDEALKNKYWDTRRVLEALVYRDNEHYSRSGVAFYRYSKPVISDFAEKKFKQLDEQSGVLSILKNNGENIVFEIVQESVQSIVEYYQHLIAYDRTIEIIAESLEIPEYTIFKRGAEDIYEGYKAVKGLISALEKSVKATYSANPAQAHIRLEALKIAFKDFDLEGYKIPEEAQKKLEMELRADLTAFKKHGNGVGQSSKLYQRLTPIKEGVEDD